MAGLWISTFEKLLTRSSIRRGGFRTAWPVNTWHLATGAPLAASGVIQYSVHTGTTFGAQRFLATATTTDMLCATVPLTELIKVKDGQGSPELILHTFGAQGGSGTASATLKPQVDIVLQHAAGSFTDTNINDVNGTLYGTTDDIRKDFEFSLTGAMSAADLALIDSSSVLNIKMHMNEEVATNQFANHWGTWLELRVHASIADPT